MLCPACNAASPDDVRFCLHCGQYLGEPDTPTMAHGVRPPPATTVRAQFTPYPPINIEPPPKRRWPIFVAFGLLAGVLLMFVGGLIAILLIQQSGGDSNPTPVASRQAAFETSPAPVATPARVIPRPSAETKSEASNIDTPTPTPTPPSGPKQPESFTIVNRSIVVQAGHFVSIRFVLTEPSRIVGRFQAYGGRNDIAVAILSESEFENYRNGGYYRAYYNTDYITADNPDISLPPGIYYLTFDDRKAIMVGKTVIAKFVAYRQS